MKSTRLLVGMAFMACSTIAMGQGLLSEYESPRDFNSVFVQFNPVKAVSDNEGAEDLWGYGFSIGYSHAFSISNRVPFYLETGLAFQYIMWSEEEIESIYYGGETYYVEGNSDTKLASLKAPLRLLYKCDVPGTKLSLVPYAGIDFRFNLSARANYEISLNGVDVTDEVFAELGTGAKPEQDLFDKDDVGYGNYTWKRFQVGWHIGLNAMINNKFLIGTSYGSDFNEITKKGKLRTVSVALGYCF